MADDTSNVGGQDRARVSTSEPYEVAYFAKKHGLSREQAEGIIKQAKGNRAAADELAATASRRH